MIGGGDVVDSDVVSTIIRHSIFEGSAGMLQEGHKGRPGDKAGFPQAPPALKEKMDKAMEKAANIIKPFNDKVSRLARWINIVAVRPIPVDLAADSKEIFQIVSGKDDPKGRAGLNLFLDKLQSEGSEKEWNALGIVQRTLEREFRSSYIDNNIDIKIKANNELHNIMRGLLKRVGNNPDFFSDFDRKAIKTIVSISIILMNPTEEIRINGALERAAEGRVDEKPFKFSEMSLIQKAKYETAELRKMD